MKIHWQSSFRRDHAAGPKRVACGMLVADVGEENVTEAEKFAAAGAYPGARCNNCVRALVIAERHK